MSLILDGKKVAEALTEKLKLACEHLKYKGVNPCLAIVRVGENKADISYEKGATKRAQMIGVAIKSIALREDAAQEDLIEVIDFLNNDDSIHGILLFRPLPKHIDDEAVRNRIFPQKDVDGISDIAMASIYSNSDISYPPCTAKSCVEILKFYGIDIEGKDAVVVGRSLVIGKPVAMMLVKENATVTICHTRTKDLEGYTKKADLIIASAGSAKMIGKDHVSKKAVVVDVGINFTDEGKMVGDVDFEAVSEEVSAITPVPGGVGAMTSTVLMKHVIEAARRIKEACDDR